MSCSKGVFLLFNSSLEILGITVLQGTWSATPFSFLSAAQIKKSLDLISVLMQSKGDTESSLVFQELCSVLSVETCFSSDVGNPSTDFIKQRTR